MKKKILKIVLPAAMILSISGAALAEDGITFTPGTYTGSGMGQNGEVTVEVTLTEDKIDAITVTSSNESTYIGEVAAEHVIDDVLSNQSLQIDSVSGCTISRAAFVTAITNALESAGADIDALKAVPAAEKVGEEKTIDTDICIIGSGGAGLTAAIEAAYADCDVVVLEKQARLGGATLLSSAMLVAGGTELQEAAGIEDSTEALKAYWMERGEGNVDEDWVNFVADNINDTLSWFMDLGVNYNSDLILFSGTADVPRAHMPAESGRELIPRLVEEAEANGVEFLTETPAVSLIQDEDGKVVGVNAENHGAPVTVNAKAVIIATGGFAASDEALAEYAPKAQGSWYVGSHGNTGDGIAMALEAGADTVFKGGYIGWKVVNPVYNHTNAVGAPIYGAANLVVNATGDRFGNENLDYPFMYEDMVTDGSDTFYFIFDSGESETQDLVNNVSDTVANLELGVEAGVCFKADTLEELAEASGLTNLADTVAQFNGAIESGTDEAFGRDTTTMVAVENGPFYALQCKKALLGTFGGINTNLTGEVVDAEDNAIAGLYAAGEVANGEFFPEIYPASGSALDVAVVAGREAGKSAAAFAKAE